MKNYFAIHNQQTYPDFDINLTPNGKRLFTHTRQAKTTTNLNFVSYFI